MSKPEQDVVVRTVDGKESTLRAVFDSGSHYTIVKEGKLPPNSPLLRYPTARTFNAATEGGKLTVTAVTQLTISVGDRIIEDDALVSPELGRDMLIGAKSMQAWDISIVNQNGNTRVVVGRDLRDPGITEVV